MSTKYMLMKRVMRDGEYKYVGVHSQLVADFRPGKCRYYDTYPNSFCEDYGDALMELYDLETTYNVRIVLLKEVKSTEYGIEYMATDAIDKYGYEDDGFLCDYPQPRACSHSGFTEHMTSNY